MRAGKIQPLLPGLADSHRARFERFHRENPEVYRQLVRLARQILNRPRFGFRCLWERLRWYYAVETDEESPKLNDHYCPYYARLLMQRHSDLAGMFETRELRAP